MPNWEEFGMQAANNAQGALLGIAIGKYQDKRQLEQQRKLQALQMAGGKEMTDYQYSKMLQMWKDTNYMEQVHQMKKAGINPALLYGMSGGGGATTGGGMGVVSGGQAPVGGKEIEAMTGMGLMGAQKALIEAQTRNVQAQTDKTTGPDTNKINNEIDQIKQNIKNLKAQEALTDAQEDAQHILNFVKGSTQNLEISKFEAEVQTIYQKLAIIKNDREISDATKDEAVKLIETQLVEAGLRNELLKSQKQATDQEIKNMAQAIEQRWYEISQTDTDLNIQEKQQKLNDWAQHEFAKIGWGAIVAGAIGNVVNLLRPGTQTPRGTKPPEMRGFRPNR